MTTSTIVWIVVAVVVALLLITAIVALAGRSRRRHRQAEAHRIREQVLEDTAKVERREALGQEAAAKARAAQAEAEVKAAEAARLQERAASHQSEAAAARDQVKAKVQQADQLDPRNRKAEDSGLHEQPHRESDRSLREQTPEAAEDRSTATHDATT
jgi:FtsZ-interacting cell division protein ZipA